VKTLDAAIAWVGREPVAASVALLGLFVLVAPLTRCGPKPPAREEKRTEATAELREESTAAAELEERRATVRHVETREERRPDGAVITTRTEDEREDTHAAAVVGAASTTHAIASERTVIVREQARPSWRLTAAAGWKLDAPELRPQVYGLDVSRRVAGPVWLGAWARTDRTAGVSLAVEW
jgi:hypothetical protein